MLTSTVPVGAGVVGLLLTRENRNCVVVFTSGALVVPPDDDLVTQPQLLLSVITPAKGT